MQDFFDKNSNVFISGKALDMKARLWSGEDPVEEAYVCSTGDREEVIEQAEN
jgi:hypothetical protein